MDPFCGTLNLKINVGTHPDFNLTTTIRHIEHRILQQDCVHLSLGNIDDLGVQILALWCDSNRSGTGLVGIVLADTECQSLGCESFCTYLLDPLIRDGHIILYVGLYLYFKGRFVRSQLKRFGSHNEILPRRLHHGNGLRQVVGHNRHRCRTVIVSIIGCGTDSNRNWSVRSLAGGGGNAEP